MSASEEMVTPEYVRQIMEGTGWHWVWEPSPNPAVMEAWGCAESHDIWVYSIGAWITTMLMNRKRTEKITDERWDCGGCGAVFAVFPSTKKCISCKGTDLVKRETE